MPVTRWSALSGHSDDSPGAAPRIEVVAGDRRVGFRLLAAHDVEQFLAEEEHAS